MLPPLHKPTLFYLKRMDSLSKSALQAAKSLKFLEQAEICEDWECKEKKCCKKYKKKGRHCKKCPRA